MIRSCADKETEKLLNRNFSRRFKSIENTARIKLAILGAASSLRDLSLLPGLRLEKLSADRAGQYSIRINDQFRICFLWRDGDAYDVEITDYH
jgi:toxin HigB-1